MIKIVGLATLRLNDAVTSCDGSCRIYLTLVLLQNLWSYVAHTFHQQLSDDSSNIDPIPNPTIDIYTVIRNHIHLYPTIRHRVLCRHLWTSHNPVTDCCRGDRGAWRYNCQNFISSSCHHTKRDVHWDDSTSHKERSLPGEFVCPQLANGDNSLHS